MKLSGPCAGVENTIYYAAYVYFEKVRVATGKKITPKRQRNEEHRLGMPLVDRRHVLVFMAKS
ncbi:hypothetical protein M422DRAFT_37182 [Sphaerobolus stellatus SS14]|uniref:Uncharacterized protein n=1 Tax=Sphaerobolus stellatus (strain SS14) TaxID=990650 RepID=A0A0C9THD9_SPHS4|nr:hypothetical protein M422DRAFT_37182 [Sphaerobolus stellatus SS14]